MTTSATAAQTPSAVEVVRRGYDAFARGDMLAMRELFAPDASWDHRNAGRFAGPARGWRGEIPLILLGIPARQPSL